MTLEWLITGFLLGVVLLAMGRRLRSRLAWLCLLLVFGLAMSSTALWRGELRRKADSREALAGQTPQQGLPDYAGSDSCRSCHPDQYVSWHRSFHRTMTQLPTAQSVRGSFNNVTLEYAGDTYRLEQHGDEFWVDMVDPDWKYDEILKQNARAGGRAAPLPSPADAPRSRKRISSFDRLAPHAGLLGAEPARQHADQPALHLSVRRGAMGAAQRRLPV
jgi:hypothetical protein